MKIKYGLILASLLSSSVMAQVPVTTNSVPEVVAPVVSTPTLGLTDPAPPSVGTNAAPKKKVLKKKHAAQKPATSKKAGTKTSSGANAAKKSTKSTTASTNSVVSTPFIMNGGAIAKQNNINIRGQARINSEVIGHLKKGDEVTVLEEVTLKHPKTDEPAQWVKIALPESMHVWVNTPLVDASNSVVKAHKVNLRGGPGENFSILGRIKAGDVIKAIGTKGDWTELESGTNAYAFVAAHLLEPKAAAPIPVVVAPPVPSLVENQTTNFPAGGSVTAPVAVTPPVPVVPVPVPVIKNVVEEPLPKRIVEREGIVGGAVSIQAPSHFELRSLDNGKTMDYLFTSTTNVVLKNYKGLTVLVSGEEELDERWPNTPVLTIQRIQVVK